MPVRVAAVLATVAFSVLFFFKTAVTIWPAAFDSEPLAGASATVLLAASVLMLAFFTTLRSRLEEGGRWALAAAATVGMAGTGIGGHSKSDTARSPRRMIPAPCSWANLTRSPSNPFTST